MAASEADILKRAEATSAVMESLQDVWVWDEMSVADFQAFLQGVGTAGRQEDTAKVAYDAKRGLVDVLFSDLEKRKVQGVGMARIRFRKDAEKLTLVEGVHEYGEGRDSTLQEANEWLAAWKLIEPTWNPTPTNTYDAFESLIATCGDEKQNLTDTKTAWRKAATHYNGQLLALEDLCVAWYGQATRVFPPDSEEGSLIRSQIPTFDDGGQSSANSASTPSSPTSP